MQAHLGAHPVERSGEEMGGTHPALQRAERVLDRLTADSHHLGPLIQTTLHRFEHCFMLPAAHSAWLWTRCALLFQRTTLAMRTPVTVQLQPFLDTRDDLKLSLAAEGCGSLSRATGADPKLTVATARNGRKRELSHPYEVLAPTRYLKAERFQRQRCGIYSVARRLQST